MATYFWSSTSSTDPTVGGNWTKSDGTTGTTPASGDDVYIQAVPGSTLANIGASNQSAINLNSLNISQTFSGTIGAAGVGGYWQISFATLNVGTPGTGTSSTGSGRVKLDPGTNVYTGNVINTGQSSDAGYPPVQLKGTNASNVLNVLGGTVGVGTNQPGESATVLTANVSGSQASLLFGSGVTWTTANVAGGASFTANSGGTTVSVASASTATLKGTAKVTTVNTSGTVNHQVRPAAGNGSDTINVYGGGKADFSGNPSNVTIGTLNAYASSTIVRNPANPGHLTLTTFALVEAGTLTIN